MPGPLMALHTMPKLAEMEVVPGVFFAAKEHLDQLVLAEGPGYKLFVGHAGWGAEQLENEMRQGAWRTLAATAESVFSTAETLWETVFRELGHSMLKDMLHVKELPPTHR